MNEAELRAVAEAYKTPIALIRYSTTPHQIFGAAICDTTKLEPVIFQQTYPSGCIILVRISHMHGKYSGKEGDVSLPESGRFCSFHPHNERYAILDVDKTDWQKQGKVALPMGHLGKFDGRGMKKFKMDMN